MQAIFKLALARSQASSRKAGATSVTVKPKAGGEGCVGTLKLGQSHLEASAEAH